MIAQPTLASAQDAVSSPYAQDRDDALVEFECPEDLGGLPDLIQRRCRAATPQGLDSPTNGLNSPVGFKGVKVLIPVAAMAAAGIALTSLKDDKPVSR